MKRKFGFLLIALLVTLFLSTAHDAYASHNDFVVLGNGSSGPQLRIFGLDGILRASRPVLNNTVTELQIDPAVDVGSGSGHERILVCGNSPTGPAIIELWERDLTSPAVLTRDVSPKFSEVSCSAVDLTGDGVDEIVVTARETGGATRGLVVEARDQTGKLLFRDFVLDSSFNADLINCFNDECTD